MNIEDLIQTLLKASPAMALVAACNILGLVLRKAEFFNDRYIPLTLVLMGAVVYPLLADNRAIIPWNVPYPVVYNALIGLALGGASVGTNQLFRKFFGEPKEEPPPPPPRTPRLH